MAYNTGNSLGSTDPRDLSDNAQNFDQAVNNAASSTWTDRFGKSRTSLAGQIGYIGTGVDGAIENYASGQVLSTYNTIIRYNSEFYRPSASATLPYTTTATLPDVDANLVAIGDANLRQDLAGNPSAGNGAALVNGATIYVGSVAELEGLSLDTGVPVNLTDSLRFGSGTVKSGMPPSDPLKGAFVVLANGNYWERDIRGVVRPEWFGADPDASDNSAALQAAGNFAFERELFLDCSGSQFLYSTTLDFTAFRHIFLKGDCDDTENVGTYELRFSGSGYAIDCDSIFLDKIGIEGGAKGDSIVTGRHGIKVTGVITHRDSFLARFDTGYDINGGFYHSIKGGSLREIRNIYDFNVGLYNFDVNAQHMEFVNCVQYSGGDGPLKLGGSYEKFTGRIVAAKAGAPKLLTVLDSVYVENAPDLTVAPGLTGDDTDTYSTDRLFILGQSGVVGSLNVFFNAGITNSVFRFSSESTKTDFVDLAITLSGTYAFSGSVFEGAPGQGITNGKINVSYTTAETKLYDILDADLQQEFNLNNIEYNNPEGFIERTKADLTPLFVNGWEARTELSWNQNQPFAYIMGDFIHLSIILSDLGSPTSDTVMTLPELLRPAHRLITLAADTLNTYPVLIDSDGVVSTSGRSGEMYINVRYPRKPF